MTQQKPTPLNPRLFARRQHLQLLSQDRLYLHRPQVPAVRMATRRHLDHLGVMATSKALPSARDAGCCQWITGAIGKIPSPQ